ncbi:hypothetical protein DFH09DRAFT_1310918 [Mycena vulgaris]|nr:hypothetical protein DFH09DRAFT_1310918 [Mycena vulgaris]
MDGETCLTAGHPWSRVMGVGNPSPTTGARLLTPRHHLVRIARIRIPPPAAEFPASRLDLRRLMFTHDLTRCLLRPVAQLGARVRRQRIGCAQDTGPMDGTARSGGTGTWCVCITSREVRRVLRAVDASAVIRVGGMGRGLSTRSGAYRSARAILTPLYGAPTLLPEVTRLVLARAPTSPPH